MDFIYRGKKPATPERKKIPAATPAKRFDPQREVSYRSLERMFLRYNREASDGDLGLLHKAFEFMRAAHKGQMRKDKTTPYEIHPYNVAYYMAKAGGNLHEVSAALLHDALEDCDVTLNQIQGEFGDQIGELVSLLSTPKIRLNTYFATKRLGVGGGKTVPIVMPGHSHYNGSAYRQSLENQFLAKGVSNPKNAIRSLQKREKDLKEVFKPALVTEQKSRLFPKTGFTDLNWSAIWIKQFDALHNLQTIESLKPEQKEKFVRKSID
ncbi:MAG: HD domain-containing protein, partial [Candidatus Micrarchaeota archaeon]|nr:HD domain-containing protein [Candidatus Micrarchaeota archaeon]